MIDLPQSSLAAEREPSERAVAPELLEASNTYGVASVSRNLLPLLALYGAIPYVADHSLALAWCLAPIVGLLIYRLTMIMHDSGHATLFTSRRANRLIGKFLGHVTGVDFDCFKQKHWEHHKRYGLPGDPQGFHYIGISRMTRRAFAWHVIKPLLGANLRYVFPESFLHPRNVRAAFATGELAVFAAVQLVLMLLLTGAGRHPSLALLPIVSAATFGLFLSQLRGIAEHAVGDASHAESFVRSHGPDLLGRLLLYAVHFNLHEEHHRYPAVPSCHLPALHRDAASQPAAHSTMWQTLSALARSRP